MQAFVENSRNACQRILPHDDISVHEENDAAARLGRATVTRRRRSQQRAELDYLHAARGRRQAALIRRAIVNHQDFVVSEIGCQKSIQASLHFRAAVVNGYHD